MASDLNAGQATSVQSTTPCSPLSQFLWISSSDLLEKVKGSKFIEGVAKGDLDPSFYGNFILQDGAYLCEVAKLWSQLSESSNVDEIVRAHAKEANRKFQESAAYLFNGWNVRDEDGYGYGVVPKKPIRDYLCFTREAMLEHWPDMLIATYACLKLWKYIIDDHLGPIVKPSNIYRAWVDESKSGGSLLRAQATLMDKNETKWYNRDKACKIFRTAMHHEINFFNKAGHET